MYESSQICNGCGASSRPNAKFCPNCGQSIQISSFSTRPSPISSTRPTLASTSSSQGSSSGCGKIVGMVFLALIVFGAWNNAHHSPTTPPTQQPTIPGQWTPTPGIVPSYIAPDAICQAYQAWSSQDPYYNQRCQEAMQKEQQYFANGITASSYQNYREYYANEEALEYDRANYANQSCSGIPFDDPTYSLDCYQAEDRVWRTGL